MQQLHFSIHINAPKEKVWDTMLEDASYRKWTVAFNPGSYYVGTLEQGTDVQFLGPHPDGSGEGGMYSRIKENRLYEFLSIQHLGFVRNGVIDTESEEVKKWTPAFENYTFTPDAGGTTVSVAIDVADEYAGMFEDMWPKALVLLKELAEK